MDFAPLVVALALVWKVVDFVKHVRVRDIDAVVAQASVWVAGVIVTFLLAATDFASGVDIGDRSLDGLNAWSLVLLGLSIGSTGSVAYDFKRAFDNSDSAAMPSLVSGQVPVTPPVTADSVEEAQDASSTEAVVEHPPVAKTPRRRK